MSSKNPLFNKRRDYWQPAALKHNHRLPADDSHLHHDLDDKRRSGQEVFQMSCSQNSTRVLKPIAHIADSKSEGEHSMELKTPKDVVVPMSKIKLGFIILALCLAVFLVALDQTIIATAVPKISEEFRAMDDVGWYGSVYMFTLCAFQLLYGKFYTYFCLKRTYLFAIGLFEIGSFICGAAPNSPTLIFGRAIAGLGCSGIFSGSLIILVHSVPLRLVPIFTGLVAANFGIAAVVGPLMGGVFTDSHLTWRWCFYINLPLGAITVLVIVFLFTPPVRPGLVHLTLRQKLEKFDLTGTAVFIPAILSLLLSLQWGGNKYRWSDYRIVVLLLLFVLLISLFIIIQIRKQDNATLPPRIMAQRSIAAGALFSMCLGAAFFMLVFYMPLWYQVIKGQTATQSGVMTLPLILGVIIMSGLSGVIVVVCGYYTPLMILASICTAIGAGLLTTWTTTTSNAITLGYQTVVGIGLGLGLVQPLMAAQVVLTMDDIPTGTTAMIFFQSLGGALFISAAQTIFNQRLIGGLKEVIPTGVSLDVLMRVGIHNMKNLVPPALMPKVLVAFNDALTHVFYIPLALACLSMVGSLAMEWRSVKGVKLEMTAL
ncbi:hypothetical protein EG327_008884 [Venturia inaequalis]|uniref:Major facilitator superfamily (MFS) profile domain-containing protein n=1 Tax=Venturia inaequalis TaxID=5025 RepID=A0A8H3UQV7_VENIN|nr:hypothetical protein EG327_008884 [Venturia inaequalis]